MTRLLSMAALCMAFSSPALAQQCPWDTTTAPIVVADGSMVYVNDLEYRVRTRFEKDYFLNLLHQCNDSEAATYFLAWRRGRKAVKNTALVSAAGTLFYGIGIFGFAALPPIGNTANTNRQIFELAMMRPR